MSQVEPIEHGRQRERTRLAWRRTTLSAAVVGLLIEAKLILAAGPPTARMVPAAILASATVASWLGLVWLAYRRIRTLDAGRADALRRTPATTGALVLALSLAGVTAALLLRL